MADPQPGTPAPSPDFYIAAIGRSGSTMLCNWLSTPPDHVVFNEPSFLRPMNTRLLQIQLRSLGMPVPDDEWAERPEAPLDRFQRLMGPRLAGRRWAAKEVLCEQHFAMTRAFSPPRVIVTVRNIVDVALSLFEKHRLQDNLDRFSDEWVVDYCLRESAGILEYLDFLEAEGTPVRIARYEQFAGSADERSDLARFVCWPGGGDVTANFADFGRGFESERHLAEGGRRSSAHRSLPEECVRLAMHVAERCSAYQERFGYPG
jgi:hypothetical protein